MARHGEVQPEGVAVDDVYVASFGAPKGVDSAAEGTVRPDVHHNPGILAVNSHWEKTKEWSFKQTIWFLSPRSGVMLELVLSYVQTY